MIPKLICRKLHKTVSTSIVRTWNEWDPLEEIIVGIPDKAAVPPLSIESKLCISPDMWDFYAKNGGKLWSDALGNRFWSNVIDEQKEFVNALRNEGVKVVLPEAQDFIEKYKIPNYETSGMYCAMPRDLILIIGDEIIEAPMTWRSRYFEVNSYRKLIQEYWKNGASWVACPKPTFKNLFENDAKPGSKIPFVTNESEPTFDAADFIRAGRDVFVQRSQVTNELGIKWVKNHLRTKGIRVTRLTFNDPRPMHIDATFVPLKPGIILSNPDRICHQLQHMIDAGWKSVTGVCRKHNSNHPYYLASPWIAMNVLMISEDKVIVEAEDTGMIKLFESLNIKPIPVKFRHCNSIGGGFHCWSSDIRRRGELKSYFDWKPGFYAECHNEDVE